VFVHRSDAATGLSKIAHDLDVQHHASVFKVDGRASRIRRYSAQAN
jgi:hypothetical protein